MNKNYREVVRAVINYIEMHIHSQISLDTISKQVGLSKYHLHRIFKALTSKSLIEYTRERKLACSLKELLSTDLKIIDIAVQYGFSYEQCYIRAFKKCFGISPTEFRTIKQEIPITPIIDTTMLYPLNKGLMIEPRFIMKPSFQIIGIEYKIYHEANLENATVQKYAINFSNHQVINIQHVKNAQIYIGFVRYSENMQVYNYYITATEVERIEQVSEGLTSHTISDHHYTVFKYIGFHSIFDLNYEKLLSIYNYIRDIWFSAASTKPCASFHFERINLEECREDYCEMEIFYPVSLN